jgi:replicative DNA helicase
MIAFDAELSAASVREDELSLLAYALQAGGAVEVCNLVRGAELQNPWFGAYLDLMASRLAKGEPVDEESMLYVVMRNRGRFGDPLAFAAIGDLRTGLPRTSSALADLVARIRERHLLREVGFAARALRDVATGEPTRIAGTPLPFDPAEATAQIGQHLLALVAPSSADEECSVGVAAERNAESRQALKAAGKPLSLTTGHQRLNRLLSAGGMTAGQLIVVAGATGSGKTAMAIGMACDVAEQGHRTGIVSLEMPIGEVGDRLLARVSGADLRHIASGAVDDDPAIVGWREYLRQLELPIWKPKAGVNLAQVAAKAMAWKAHRLSLLIVDHLGWVRTDPAHERHRADQQIGAVANGCKELAGALGIPVVLLVQLNREGSKRTYDHKQKSKAGAAGGDWWDGLPFPQLSDLKDSSAIEQAADVVLFPLRHSELVRGAPADEACFVIGKQRNGPQGVVAARWHGPSASYLCADHDDGGAS